jgi:hypothetical protein
MNVVYKRTSLFGRGTVTLFKVAQGSATRSHRLRFEFSFLTLLRVMLPIGDFHLTNGSPLGSVAHLLDYQDAWHQWQPGDM